jgi:hypothetical protein
MDIQELLSQPAITLGSSVFSLGQALIAVAAIIGLFIFVLGVSLWRSAKARALNADGMRKSGWPTF